MSFVDRLFPQEELEALGNRWHEPAPKRRKVGHGDLQALKSGSAAQRRHSNDIGSGERRHRLSTPTPYLYGRQQQTSEQTKARSPKRSNSDPHTFSSCMPSPAIPAKPPATNKSCLPSFIEPSILKNYLRHLHPKDSHRYTSSDRQNTESYVTEDAVSSPGSLVADSTASPASTESCPTPAAVCEQFRSGPFGHIFDGMRLTENERDLMEDLLSPITLQSQYEEPSKKRKQDEIKVEVASEDYYSIDQALLQKMFPTYEDRSSHADSVNNGGFIDTEEESDVHSSGLSPAAEAEDEEPEETATSHRGFVIYDYDAVSVDDFFDLEEAST
ncbi:hypothetical protein H2200_007818 [Cladophialophora chaetospira]|uniref:Uncharacterized protein n=1 Tax=Cladophialophora chaetospira TaxID=386627 RepID=A0AA38X6G6_9EURO|nr:hypothetical protein H2200_007818 [Cladophialophora chaetospira]